MEKDKKPNILLIVVDSLRADRITKEQRFAKIPNIMELAQKGTIFSQVISTSDVTGIGLGSLFSGSYPFETGITQTSIDNTKMSLFKILKENGYKLFGTVPKFTIFEKTCQNFDDVLVYDNRKWKEDETILGKSGKNVLKFFQKNIGNYPWFHYIHLVDIHGVGKTAKINEEFDYEEFGETKYDKLLSTVDFWIKNIFKQISMKETLIILTSDHGEYIGHDFRDMPKFYKIMRKLKKKFPKVQSIGEKIFVLVLTLNEKIKIKTQRINVEKQKGCIPRGYTKYLYDDVVKIPLIISGYKTPNGLEINNLVRQIDIYPTILKLVNIKINGSVTGRDIFLSMENNQNELPAYIETGSTKPKTLGKTIGIRTSTYKYFRNRIDSKSDVYLFNLIKDPNELKNIALENPDIVNKYEKILKKITKDSEDILKGGISDEEKMIEDELRKMGYL
jgi:arylsulfatase A-like enzyme